MSTSSQNLPSTTPATSDELRLQLSDEAATNQVDGTWWPRSRNLQREAADLVDHFPSTYGRISRLLFSRPDWDGSSTDGRGVRSIRAARGMVKVGSFPSDDTHLMILTMSSGRRLKLLVIPSDAPAASADEHLGTATGAGGTIDMARWDDESPAG